MKPIVVAIALMLLPTQASAEPFAGKLAQLPPIVREHVRDLERGCSRYYDGGKPDYRLSDVVHVHSLSGARTRDYIVDARKFGCRRDGSTSYTGWCGSGGCHLAVYVQRRGAWSAVPDSDVAIRWYTLPRPGKRTVLVIKRRCHGDEGAPCYGSHSCSSSTLRVTCDGVKEAALRRQNRKGC